MIDISVSNLVKEFEVGKKILDGLTFQVDAGERVGLLGPNGCGKTTLLRILTGVMDYDEGEVVIAPGKRLGLISRSPSIRRAIRWRTCWTPPLLPCTKWRRRWPPWPQKWRRGRATPPCSPGTTS